MFVVTFIACFPIVFLVPNRLVSPVVIVVALLTFAALFGRALSRWYGSLLHD